MAELTGHYYNIMNEYYDKVSGHESDDLPDKKKHLRVVHGFNS